MTWNAVSQQIINPASTEFRLNTDILNSYGFRTLKCENISDVDLPIQLDNSKFAGHYDNLELRGVGLFPTQLEVMSNIPAGAVSGVTFDKVKKKLYHVLLEFI